MLLKIVGLNDEKFFYQVKINSHWKQFTKSIDNFIKMMFILFPHLRHEIEHYQFDNKYSVANWLYNYGEEIKPCETYVFYFK